MFPYGTSVSQIEEVIISAIGTCASARIEGQRSSFACTCASFFQLTCSRTFTLTTCACACVWFGCVADAISFLRVHRALAQIPSYVVSFGYVFMDTYDKTMKAKENAAPAKRNRLMLETAADTLLWQTAASVVVPGFTIHRVVSATSHALRHHANKSLRKWAPTFIGLGASTAVVLGDSVSLACFTSRIALSLSMWWFQSRALLCPALPCAAATPHVTSPPLIVIDSCFFLLLLTAFTLLLVQV